MATRASTLYSAGKGIHFKEPWRLTPMMAAAAQLGVYDAADARQAATTVAFFTEMARRGLQDTTNWTSDTYKTLLTVSSGKGYVAAIVGCTAGGAETTTFRITVDGLAHTIAVGTLAAGERACLLAGYVEGTEYTTAENINKGTAETLEADKATFGAVSNIGSANIPPWRFFKRGIPLLTFDTSLVIEAKHSANITNSTATAYSAVQYHLGL
jgi:hypothetical protein